VTGRSVALALTLTLAPTLLPGCAPSRDPDTDGAVRLAPPTSPAPAGPGGSGVGAGLRWRPCRDGECARLSVPLRPDDRSGPRIRLALFRARATGPAGRRLGPLLVNPGGPGAPGIPLARHLARTLPGTLRDRFDVVGWDPRGSGASTAVDCGDRLDPLFAVDTAPDSPAELAELARVSRAFARRCARRSGELLAHVSTDDTVGDLERIRRALGAERLSFLGYSYGTLLGARYAAAHPRRVRAMVLDGAVDPSLPLEALVVGQARGFDQALAAALAACDADRSCPLDDGSGDRRGAARAAYDRLRARVEGAPVRGRVDGEPRALGPAQLDLAVGAALYGGPDGDRALRDGIAAGLDGDPGPLLRLFDAYVGRRTGGRYSTLWPAFLATTCLDGPRVTEAEMPGLLERAARAAPDFGPANVGLGWPCAVWPVPPVRPDPAPIAAPGAPPILVIGTTGDPATPYAWAAALAAQLGSGRLVTVTGRGHTSTFAGNRCLDRLVTAYLIDGALPAAGARC
jgi:pimeloyl-ACP methyl ester carboxylesterase